MQHKLPTIKEIAQRLNVSVSTVSRALADHPRIGLRTKMQVKKLATELNYEPNVKAISLKQNKSFVIGVILPYIREEFFSQAICGIEAAALQHNYTILFGQSYDDPQKEKSVVEAMKKQRVDGLIISLTKQTNNYDHFRSLDNYDIPVVYFDRVPALDNINKVFCNLYKGTIDMVGWLVNSGYRRIALINGPANMYATKERLKGYMEGMSRKKLKVDMELVETTDLSKEGTHQAMKNLLSLKHPPKVIISFNDYVHMDAVQYAQRQHIDIDKDLVFVSYANLSITKYTAFPPLASIEQYPYGQGEKAMELVVKILHDREENKNNETFYVEEIQAKLMFRQLLELATV